jgi:hypothetical protein
MIEQIAGAIRYVFQWISGRSEQANRPDMIDNKNAKRYEAEHNEHTKEVRDGDIDRIRRDAA